MRSTAGVERDGATARRRRPVEDERSAQRITGDEDDGGRATAVEGVADEATACLALTQKQHQAERYGQRRRSNATGPRRVGGDRSSTKGQRSGARAVGTMAEGRWRRGALPRKQQKARGVDTEATAGGALRATAEVERDGATARRRRPVEYEGSAQRITGDEDDGGGATAVQGVADEATSGVELTQKQRHAERCGPRRRVERDRATARRRRRVEYGRSAQRITSDGHRRRSDSGRALPTKQHRAWS